MSTSSGPGPAEEPSGKEAEVRSEEESSARAADPKPGAEAADRARTEGGRLVEQAGGYEVVPDDDDAD
jgi:hypothetical protein